jgi:hypothetical protein
MRVSTLRKIFISISTFGLGMICFWVEDINLFMRLGILLSAASTIQFLSMISVQMETIYNILKSLSEE